MEHPPWLYPRAAYIHVPFCAHHCGYCDFAVIAGHDHLIDHYLEALARELQSLGEPRAVRTLFVGGGTPTHLNAEQLERLLRLLRQWLPVSSDATQPGGSPQLSADLGPAVSPEPGEWSIEATPDSLDTDKLALLRQYGVTRLSIGVQTFHPQYLTVLERRHTAAQVPRLVESALQYGFVVSLDLIFGIPGSSLADWEADLNAAISLNPHHISTYGLTYEKGTPLGKRRHRGEVQPVPEEVEAAMYETAINRLEAAGFEQYEISNFARAGHQCRHNLVYWANEAYYGFGVGAARYVFGRRELNVRDTRLYIRRLLSGESPTFQSECLPPRERALETLAVQLRRRCGVDHRRFREQTGFAVAELVGETLSHLGTIGLLDDDGVRLRLTRRGLLVADAVIAELMAAADPSSRESTSAAPASSQTVRRALPLLPND